MDQTPAASKTTIAIKLPSLLQERLAAFPVIHLLRDAFPNADLHFISPDHRIEILYSLPFEGFWHSWNDEEIKTPLDTHRLATTLRIPPIDLYISLGTSLRELTLGTFLGAKRRVGFAEGWRTIFTTLPVKRPVGHHITEEYFALYQALTNNRVPPKLKVMGREMLPFFKGGEEEKPYLAVDLYPFAPGKLDDFWVDYFSMFEDKRFVLFFSDEEAKGGLLAEGLINRLPKQNKYDLFLNSNWLELGKMLAHARGLVARSGASVSYATYLGTQTLAIYETGDPRKDAPFYNFADWRLMDLRDPTLSAATTPTISALKAKATVDPVMLFQLTSETFLF